MTILKLSWSISRGRYTYGYNICRLEDRDTGRRYRCMGGGYDMVGTVVGDWLQERHQDKLRALAEQRRAELTEYVGTMKKIDDLYGMVVLKDGRVSLDGASGLSCMKSIAEAIGINITACTDKRGHTDLFFVTERESS